MTDEIEALRTENERLKAENAKLRARAIAAEKIINRIGRPVILPFGDKLHALQHAVSSAPFGDLHPFVFYDGQWWGSNDSLQERKRQNGEVE